MEPTTTPPPTPAPPARNWWGRNWKWFVPTGCLAIVILTVVFIGSILLVVFGAMKSTDVYKTAVSIAQRDPLVIDALGSPIKTGMLLSGNTHMDGASGQADLAIPISGPKGNGTLYLVATKSTGRWTFSKLVVEVQKTKKRINLHTGDGLKPAANPE